MTKKPIVALFDPHRLRLAREYNRLKRAELAERLGISPSAITQLELGLTRPTSAHLAALSMCLRFPPDFFLNDGRRSAVQLDREAFFRSLRSTKQIDRDRASAKAFLIAELFDSIQRLARLPSVDIPADLHLPANAQRADIEARATALRRRWNVARGPIPNVVRLLEVHGIVVSHCIFDCREMSSFSLWLKSRPIVVLKEELDDLARLRSDAAHELGHLVLHERPESASHLVEDQAQGFAASFLTPADQIGPLLPKSFDINRLAELKHTWGVSIAALLYRAHELGRMSERTYRRAMMAVSKNGWRVREPFPLNGKEAPQLLDRSLEAIERGGTHLGELISQCRLPADFLSHINPKIALEEVFI
jgi:Zn-dependent peptidase ImmA (M78 family)/transcriptional regulator with XRE-family HTH domain